MASVRRDEIGAQTIGDRGISRTNGDPAVRRAVAGGRTAGARTGHDPGYGPMTGWNVARAVDALRDAEERRTARGRITGEWPELGLDAAYQVQDRRIEDEIAAGRTVIGVKLGLTSRAKQRRMGIDSPLTGWLTDAMPLPSGAPVPVDRLIHPRAEPEIVFVLGRRLEGPGVTAAAARAAVESVHAGVEIIDSRFADYSFALPDVVADNASAARFVLGSRAVSPRRLDLVAEACRLSVDGEVVASATGAAVQGDPAQALALAVNALARRQIAVEAGWIVLTGGMTDAVPVTPGRRIGVDFENLGSIMIEGA
jgi:2-oxo-3-hexenedioate decarboxylase